MTEFGHQAVAGRGFRIDTWGAGPFSIAVDGKVYAFEDSDRFGPCVLNKRGDPAERQPSERHPFWAAHGAWVMQGRRLADDGRTCLYDPLQPTKVAMIGRRHALVLSFGDEGGGYEVVSGAQHD